MSDRIEGIAFSIEGLRRDADEIEACGGGNEAAHMRWAAARIAELEAEVARLRAYGDPAFYVCAAAQWEKATARAKRETEYWKRAAQAANKRALSDDATIRSLRKKLDAALGITSAE